ncbi:SusC/RagA family TonB-linked outer membrane protein [Marinifilum sp.]|uniref:SusC/RagA family TonB-linked outer membrane protein n=1 Tax=Marinifilum sp. TaxID=2033137 RepID=UPI003BAB26C8
MKKCYLKNLHSNLTNPLSFGRKISSLALLVAVLSLPFAANANVNSLFEDNSAVAVQQTVTGTVTEESGMSLPGVSVIVKGTTIGTVTDVDGKFEIAADPSSVLVFSFVGMTTQEITVGSQTVINVVMVTDALQVDEVVVTALGIKREEKSLTYATQQVKGEELTTVRTDNMMNALSGKAAGVVISPSTSGVGGSTKVILRGYTSVQGNNQPLYVVDGVPLQNLIPNQAETGNGFGGGVDAGDGISNLNPDDIESVNVLKGASAAALYGSQAANGVIIITTKSGKKGKAEIKFSSSFQMDRANVLYEWQDRYGALGNTSWGARSPIGFGHDNGKELFETGYNLTNTLSFSGGTEKSRNYVSMSNTLASGIVPTNELEKYNLSVRNTTDFFDSRLKLDSKVNLLLQKMKNSPSAPGSYFNPIRSAYLMPVDDDLNSYENNYEVFDPERNMMTQNWPYIANGNGPHQNPYWIFNRNRTNADRARIIANLAATFQITNDLDLKVRGNIDRTYDNYERKVYAGTRTTLSHLNGRYEYRDKENTQYYGDVLLSYNKQWEDYSLSATIGTSVTDVRFTDKGADSNTKGLFVPNLFFFKQMIDGGQNRTHVVERSQLQSYFGTASVGYKNLAYLDITARQDKSSTLPKQNNTYFYPSVGGSVLLHEVLDRAGSLPLILDYAKVRASYSEVGNDVPVYKFRPYDSVDENGTINRTTVRENPDLKPERTSAYELGMDLRMFKNRVSLDFAYYNTTTDKQYFEVAVSGATSRETELVNGGKVENSGFEITLGGIPVQNSDLVWDTRFNFSTNKSNVKDLPSELVDRDGGFNLSDQGGYKLRVQEGGEFGEIWGTGYRRVNGKLVVTLEDDVAKPVAGDPKEDEVKLGSINNDFRLSWANDFKYKNFSLSFLIDGTFGGNVLSTTETEMHQIGVSKQTGEARDNFGVVVDAVIVDDNDNILDNYQGRIETRNYYGSIPVAENVYDATNIRLREVSLGYSFPKSIMNKVGFLSEARLSVVGRNLFFFYIDAPYDPEGTQSTSGLYLMNSDYFGVPSTRSYGLTLNVKF